MSKKNFDNIRSGNNLGGGLKNLLGPNVLQEEEKKDQEKLPGHEKIVTHKEASKRPGEKISHEKLTDDVLVKEKTTIPGQKEKDSFSRSFYIYESEYMTIENFVKHKIMQGDIRFSQKNAITEALNLLREKIKHNNKADSLTRDIKEDDKIKIHSFNMLKEDFKFIEDVLRIRRMQGQTKFTQANVLTEALILLKKKYSNL
jgi:hypothetical protein